MTSVDREGRALVLIVEDSQAIQRLLIDSLTPEYATVTACDGEDALRIAVRERPDLVILDLLLPVMDGESLVEELRAVDALEDMPILMLTASADSARLTRLLEGPVQDVVRKPFDNAEVRARVGNLLAEKRTRDLLNETIGKHETNLVRLAEQVAAQQTALRNARQAAEQANRVKTSFLRTMSHELRTPITAMEIQMNIFERDPESALSDKARLGMARLARSTKRLRWIIDTVMAWAQIEGGRYELDISRIDMARLVAEVKSELDEFAHLRRVSIECEVEDDAIVWSDRSLSRLIILNLLSRAVQDTARGRVVVTAGPSRDGGVWVGVRDGASRLSEAEERQLFRPHHECEPLHKRSGSGSGLELHIVWDIARAVDGTVDLERDSSPGNLLMLSLPKLSRGRTTATYARPVHPEEH